MWEWRNDDPFGANAANTDPDGDGNLFEYNLRFPGQYRDKETGLSYNYFRTYDPETGKYLQSDPIGLLGDLNSYAYVENNPLSNIDPLGLRALTQGEISLAQTMFGSSIDYSKAEIRQEKWAGLIPVPKDRAMAPSGKIYFHPDNKDYRADFSLASQSLQALFIHEMTHVWQYQNGISPIFGAIAAGGKYRYELGCGKDLADYNIEQQGQIIMDFFIRYNGYSVYGAYGSQEHNPNNTTAGYLKVLDKFISNPSYVK